MEPGGHKEVGVMFSPWTFELGKHKFSKDSTQTFA